MSFKEIDIKELNINPFTSIGSEWMLITAGKEDNYNTMTASWGHVGALWGNHLIGRPTVEIFVRPSRYTDRYIDENECFSLSFFSSDFKNDLLYLGSHSGKDEDKVSKTNLTPIFLDGVPAFKEANLVFIVRKLYKGKIEKEGFIDKSIVDRWYKDGDFHDVYIAEILKVFSK